MVGLTNIQYAVKDNTVYVLEANPRASRTVPFVSKASGLPLAKIAAKLMVGRKLSELNIKENLELKHVAVKEAVFPFNKLPGVDPILAPEMKSTGEVMGIDYNFGIAYYKAELAAGMRLPATGTAFLSVKDRDKPKSVDVAKGLSELGFSILATKGTSEFLRNFGIETKTLLKTTEGRPNIVDLIINKEVDLIINTPSGKGPRKDGYEIRRAAIEYNVPYITTIPAALATVKAGKALREGTMTMKPIHILSTSVL